MLWQALGLAGGLAAVGALISVGTNDPGTGVADGVVVAVRRLASGQPAGQHQPPIITLVQILCLAAGITLLAVLWWVLLTAFAAGLQARRRQEELLSLLAYGDPKAPGALVVDHPAAAAYCLPGIRSSTIVVSVGTLDLLAPAELAAVLAHERAHVRARHDLVLIPFTSLRRAFPKSTFIARSCRTVALLVEMMADDHALRALPVSDLQAAREQLPARELAKALIRFGTAGASCAPAGALAAAEGEITARVTRLLEPPPPLARAAQAGVVLAAGLLVTSVILLLVLPVIL
ncbi:MAG TPA: M56 family metallopeptidase [Trebonia sp.]|nr:M56 family metallopeptidase [Trebonia sp.]